MKKCLINVRGIVNWSCRPYFLSIYLIFSILDGSIPRGLSLDVLLFPCSIQIIAPFSTMERGGVGNGVVGMVTEGTGRWGWGSRGWLVFNMLKRFTQLKLSFTIDKHDSHPKSERDAVEPYNIHCRSWPDRLSQVLLPPTISAPNQLDWSAKWCIIISANTAVHSAPKTLWIHN